KTLSWFTNNYYGISKSESGDLYLNDLRYGVMGNMSANNENYVFRFQLIEKDGKLDARQINNTDIDPSEMMGDLWERINGI
ncbi:MAG: hypothetical protein AAF985_19695, partial [Bacteroidota bacterium]